MDGIKEFYYYFVAGTTKVHNAPAFFCTENIKIRFNIWKFCCMSLGSFHRWIDAAAATLRYICNTLSDFQSFEIAWIRNISGTCLLNNIPYFIRSYSCGDGCFSFAIRFGGSVHSHILDEWNKDKVVPFNFDICTGFSLVKSAPNEKQQRHTQSQYNAHTHTHSQPNRWWGERRKTFYFTNCRV